MIYLSQIKQNNQLQKKTRRQNNKSGRILQLPNFSTFKFNFTSQLIVFVILCGFVMVGYSIYAKNNLIEASAAKNTGQIRVITNFYYKEIPDNQKNIETIPVQ